VNKPLIDYLNEVVADPRFAYEYWNIYNQLYNPSGVKLTKDFSLPVSGQFDLIWLFSVFTHLEPADASALLGILRHYIRPGGHLFSAFIDNSISTFEDKILDQLQNAYYSEQYMRQLLAEWGY
jgi:2-polyprenyl-3-methyl-5-hydroxy-6-metoxy-1,4-benzoquinol methylase